MKDLPVRKHTRLRNYNYSNNGAYFITFCVKGRHEMLGRIVGRGDLDAPLIELSEYGLIVEQYINLIESHYDGVIVDKYVIMTNHIHMIVSINRTNGASGSPRPTNALIPNLMKALKKITNGEFGFNMWQTGYYDHIIRNKNELNKIWRYIDENPVKWQEDCYFVNQ